MGKLRTLFHTLVASASLAVGSNLGAGQVAQAASAWEHPQPAPKVVALVASEVSLTSPVPSAAELAGLTSEPPESTLSGRFAQVDLDEPLDAPLDGDDGATDEPLDNGEQVADDPLDAPVADEPVAEPVAEDPAQPPVAETEPLDAPIDDSIAVEPDDDDELLDAPIAETPVAVAPVTEVPLVAAVAPAATEIPPVAEAAPPVAKALALVAVTTSVKPKGAAVSHKGKPVTTVRKKVVPQDRVVVVAGRRPLPAELASCDVAVGAGRAAVGSDCEPESIVAGFQPAIPRVAGSSALISTDDPSLITSRRDGVQIGEYPEPTLGDSIATTVRAAIFPEDVVVPDVLIVPGEVVVAGNQSREDPIVLWRSELEQASASTGIPVEMLATVISAAAKGEPAGDAADGRVGIMQVPVSELVARGISEDQWNDPATNIRVGAELLASGASTSEVQSSTAVTEYLTGPCPEGSTCNQPAASEIDALIVHYRLRMTDDSQAEREPEAEVAQAPGWPFQDDSDPEPAGPFGDLWRDEEQGAEQQPALPNMPGNGSDDDSGRAWPWPRRPGE